MPFKIVQTIQNGKEQLSICPSKWENDFVLSLPRKNLEILSKMEFSVPNPDWTKVNCIVERNDLPNYEHAEHVLKEMIRNAQPEDEDDKSLIIKNLFKGGNVIAEQVMNTSNSLITLPPHMDQSDSSSDNQLVIDSGGESAGEDLEKLTDFEQILYNQKILFDNQNIMMKNQKKMMLAISKLSTKLDKIHSTHDETECDANDSNEPKFNLKPIETLEEFQTLEEALSDDNTKERYKKKYSIFCSRGKGVNCAYQLVDIFFTREFLTRCSWSGCTRGSGMKISIKTFKNFLNFFFELVHECDSDFTMNDNYLFFKSILKNATKRTYAKFQRISTSRKRQKISLSKEKVKEDEAKESSRPTVSESKDDCNSEDKSVTVCGTTDEGSTINMKNNNDDDNVSKTVKISKDNNKDAKNATLTFNVILKVD